MRIKKDIQKKISTLKNLPTLPHILVKLIAACNREDINMLEVSNLVEKDPGLSSKILKLVNSASYGLPKKIESIQHSISYLGTGTIKNIAIGSSVHQAFQPPTGNKLFNLKAFWWHSLRCAVLARLIAQKINHKNPEEAFLTGLLHDIGRLVLWSNYPEEYLDLLEKYKGRPDLILAGEIRQGVTHCEVGAWLLNRWNLQPFMVDAVLYHHEPLKRVKNAFPLVQIVWAANALSRQPVPGQDREKNVSLIFELCGLSPSQVDGLLSQVDKEASDIAALLDIEIEEPDEKAAHISENDQKKQELLVSEVRDSSLLLGMLQNLLLAHDEDAILAEISQGLQVLFDVKEVVFFLFDAERDCLIGRAVQGNEKSAAMGDLFIPMGTEKSLPVASLLKGKSLDLFAEQTDVDTVLIDVQIIRFLGKEGIRCVPMLANGDYVGVIVLAINHTDSTHISDQANLLNMFCRQAAVSIHSERMRQTPLKKVQTERAGASSVMARKVVHEVNNPLGIIKNYLKILGIKLSAQNIAQDEIGIIGKEIDRIANILRTLTSFSENNVNATGTVDVNGVLSDLLKIMKDPLRDNAGIEVHLDLSDSLPAITSDVDSLKQIFINIIKNAAEAMKGGNVFVRTRLISDVLDVVPDREQDDHVGYVEISIEDDGPGIPDEILSRLYDPFVSSKEDGHSGLGLSIAYNLVKALRGTLTCESEKGKGTCFKVTLPL
jgi:HD-like signal output (HDOD) protein/signal transduction histidine kinase